ncbi:hypothetical protein SAMN04487948_108115 [Halogranum amylolyticum]|uniref:Lipoprotein n=1 Tax=Halogranum amylolyticum TaxID=660520 RepID=A0A1H8TTT0_9EURY|nr:Hvo_1808 family surface protein [Halogranum amylolyticum]SEO94281.1 hypothetical protein SAMN04487948_108115 [Halogranum amylolyticum]
MSRQLAVLAVFLVVLAGCAAPVTPPTAADPDWEWPDDPPSDRLGWENGYWYNESLDVDQSDGLDADEREALVARTMARVERIRGLEFERPVPVDVVSREQYRQSRQGRSTQGDRNAEYRAWNDQVWEALLLVGEDREASDVLEELYGGSVAGFYSSSRERIVVVSDSETPQIDRATLAHELVHALQDQQFGLGNDARTQDGQLARSGIVEGDARYVEYLYEQRCERGTFDCVPTPESGTSGGASGLSVPGVFVTVYTPYSEGPALVDRLYRRGGWDAVDAVYENSPASTEQLIHPETYPDEAPVDVSVPDRSAGNWSRFDLNPQADTVGEASLYAMLWQNGYVDRASFRQDESDYSAYNYTHPASAGWGGDRVVPYESGQNEYGYVWALEWDTERDARQFVSAYESILVDELGGERVAPRVYRVPEDRPFGDAFRVTHRGSRVTIVNAPSVAELAAVHRRN